MLHPHSRIAKRARYIVVGMVFLGLCLSACKQATPSLSPLATPVATTAAVSPLETPSIQEEKVTTPRQTSSDPYRAVTAEDSFAPAYEAAKAWREDAEWYGVVPFTSMTRFLALPLGTTRPSWFFRFGASDGAEYLVEVLDGQVVGTNELVIPVYIEQPLENLEPLGDTWQFLDSEAVLTAYREQKDSLLKKAPNLMMDYRLVKLAEQEVPVWMLLNAQNVAKPVFILNAMTGEVLSIE